MTITTVGVDERTERANRSVRAFRAMLPGLNGYVRAMTGKKDMKIIMDKGMPRTDGQNIFFRPPIELGDLTPHSRGLCDRRDSESLKQLCPACRVRETVLIQIYHEIAHNVFGTFDTPSEERKMEVFHRAMEENGTKYADKLRAQWDNLPDYKKKDYLNLSSLINPFLPVIVNVLEDLRVDEAMFKARKGTRVMFGALTQGIFRDGIATEDGLFTWADRPLNSQITIGVFVLGCGYDYKGWFHPDVERALEDPKLRELTARADTNRSSEGSYTLAFDILARLRELGFCRTEEDPPEEEEQADDSGTEGDEPEDQDGDEGQDSGDESGAEESDGGDGSDEQNGAESGDGEESSGGDESSPGDSEGFESGNAEADAELHGSSDERSDKGGEPSDEGVEEGDGQGEPSPGDEGGGGPEGDGLDEGSGSHGDSEQPESDGKSEEAGSTEGADEDADGGEGAASSEHSDDADGLGGEAGSDASDAVLTNEEDDTPVDMGADEGKGGIQLTGDLEYGTPEQAVQDVEVFSGHDDPPTTMSAEATADNNAVDVAVMQGEYFEKPSTNVLGVREHKWGQPLHSGGYNVSSGWLQDAEEDKYEKSLLKRAGITVDDPIPESIMGPALIQLRRTLADNARAHMEPHLRSGKINQRVLGKRAWSGDDRLFQKKHLPGKKSYAVVIGIDISGSTYGKNIAIAKRAAFAQAELCRRVGIDFAVYAHTANPDYSSPAAGWGELLVDIYVVKAFDQPWDNNTQKALLQLKADSENLDGHTLEFYRKAVEKHSATDKIILYYTDGKMPAANAVEELEILQREIQYCKAHKITLMGVGIRTDSPREHGLNTVQLDDDSDLPKVVKHLQSALLNTR